MLASSGHRRRRPGPAGPGWRRRRTRRRQGRTRRDGFGHGGLGHVQADRDLLGGDVGDGRGDEPQEAVLDAVPNQGARGGEDEEVAVEGLGDEPRQPRAPGGVRHLFPERVRTALPQVVRVVHQALRPPIAGFVHKEIHRCGLLGSSFPAVGGRDVGPRGRRASYAGRLSMAGADRCVWHGTPPPQGPASADWAPRKRCLVGVRGRA